MKIRERTLPAGWYPARENETRERIEVELKRIKSSVTTAKAGIVPHAGWEFSGKVALEVLSSVDREVETIIIVGGHLSPSDGLYAEFEEGFETPLGILKADKEMLEEIGNKIDLREDRYADNCVEIQLPFIKYLFPEKKVIGMRAAPSEKAVRLGEVIYEVAEKMKRKVAVIGSTDLTHYGLNYGFMPAGSGRQALKWVKEVNDKGFLDLMLDFKPMEAIEHAVKNRSACSAGGAAVALVFAIRSGLKHSKLLDYYTSYDIFPGDSFVGYGGIIYY